MKIPTMNTLGHMSLAMPTYDWSSGCEVTSHEMKAQVRRYPSMDWNRALSEFYEFYEWIQLFWSLCRYFYRLFVQISYELGRMCFHEQNFQEANGLFKLTKTSSDQVDNKKSFVTDELSKLGNSMPTFSFPLSFTIECLLIEALV